MGDNSDLLDWTITEAPPLDETPAPEASLAPPAEPAALPHFEPPHLSRRVWLLLGSFSALAVAAAAFIVWRSQQTMHEAVRQAITTEERWARDSNPALLASLLDPQADNWLILETGWVSMGQPSPLPDPALRAVRETPGVIQSITQIASDTVRAEVARVFSAPDGAPYTFLFAQYYRYADKQWRRTAIPASVWGETHEYVGQRLSLVYPAIDQDLAVELGPFLDAQVQKACAHWDCPPTLTLRLVLEPETPAAFAYLINPLPANEPWPLAYLSTRAVIHTGPSIALPSPHAVGAPANAASAEWLKRALAAQTLTRLAIEITGPKYSDNAYLYAFIARYLAQTGLDNSDALTTQTASALYFPDELWDLAFAHLWNQPAVRSQAARAALAQLNRLLAASSAPAAAEQRLFSALRHTFQPSSWAAEGLGLTPDRAADQLNVAALGGFQFEPPAALPDFVLSCDDGPFMFNFTTAGGPQEFESFWRPSEQGRSAYMALWSPTGEWLAASLFNNTVALNLQTGAMQLLPAATVVTTAMQLWPLAWATDSVLAYSVSEWNLSGEYHTAVLLKDLQAPHTPFEPITNAVSYLPSPDKQWAALAEVVNDAVHLSVMPVLGGPRTLIGPATNAYAWSPDSRTITYLASTAAGLALRRYDLAAQTSQTLWSAESTQSLQSFSTVAYAPDGQHLAFVIADAAQAHVVILAADGLTQTWPVTGAYVTNPAYSADGAYLAVTVYDTYGSQRTFVYDTSDYSLVHEWRGVWSFAWSTTGRQIVTVADQQVLLYTDPLAEPQLLMAANCFNGLWNPRGS